MRKRLRESHHRSRVGLLVLAGILVGTSPVHAQPKAADRGKWLVVPVVIVDRLQPAAQARGGAAPLRRALVNAGEEVLDEVSARQAIEAQAPSPSDPVSQELLADLAQAETDALHLVAAGDSERALRIVGPMLDRIGPRVASVNRKASAAMRVFDLCMYGTRAYLQKDDTERAANQTLRCKRLVPGLAPSPAQHPPEVIAAFQQSRGSSGWLRITTKPRGCPVFVNGRRVGRSPVQQDEFVAGTYVVQADCFGGRPGSEHIVDLGQGGEVLYIDAALDAALGVRPELALRYPDLQACERDMAEHATALATWSGASRALLLVPARAGELDVVRFDHGQEVGRVRVDVGDQGELGDQAHARVEALIKGRSPKVSLQPRDSSVDAERVASTAPGGGSSAPWGPLVVGTVGVVGLAVGTALLLRAGSKRDEVSMLEQRVLEQPNAFTVQELEMLRNTGQSINGEAQESEILGAIGLTVGGVATATALLWYLVWPPEAGWGWAVSPAGVQVHGRF